MLNMSVSFTSLLGHREALQDLSFLSEEVIRELYIQKNQSEDFSDMEYDPGKMPLYQKYIMTYRGNGRKVEKLWFGMPFLDQRVLTEKYRIHDATLMPFFVFLSINLTEREVAFLDENAIALWKESVINFYYALTPVKQQLLIQKYLNYRANERYTNKTNTLGIFKLGKNLLKMVI